MEPQVDKFGVLYCAWCGKPLGNHIKFYKREMFHPKDCHDEVRGTDIEQEEDFA